MIERRSDTPKRQSCCLDPSLCQANSVLPRKVDAHGAVRIHEFFGLFQGKLSPANRLAGSRDFEIEGYCHGGSPVAFELAQPGRGLHQPPLRSRDVANMQDWLGSELPIKLAFAPTYKLSRHPDFLPASHVIQLVVHALLMHRRWLGSELQTHFA